MSLNPLTLLEKAINEHGSSSILKDRLALVKDQLIKVEKEKVEVIKALEVAKQKIKELEALMPSDKFIECYGVKFRKKPSGGVEKTVYCPSCEVGMATVDNDMPFVCGKCHTLTTFKSAELPTILKEIEKDYL